MRQTENLGLNLPEGPDPYNEKDYNDNFEIIDDKLKYLADHIGGGGTYGTLTAYTNDIYEASEDPEIDAWDKVIVAVTPSLMNRIITENGTYTASQEEPVSYDGYGTVIVDVGLPDEQLVCEYDFTSDEPKKDKARIGIEANTNYVTFDTTKGCIFNAASSRFLNTLYNLQAGNSFKIEIEFGDIIPDSSQSGKRNLFTYASDTNKTNESSYSLGWRMTEQNFIYHTGAGDRTIDKPVNYWANDKMTIYYGLSVDSDGSLYLPSTSIDNSSARSLIIMDKDLITELTSPFVQWNPNFILGGGNNLFYFEVKKFRIYKLNNLTNKPVNLMSAAPGGADEVKTEIAEEPEAEEIKKEPEAEEIKQEEEKKTEETKEAELIKNDEQEEKQKSETE